MFVLEYIVPIINYRNMLRVSKLLQSVVVLLTAVSVLSQSEDDTIEFVFETNEDATSYRSSCHNFTVKRYLSRVTISAFNETEGFMQCFCSVRSTYVTSNVTVRAVNGDQSTDYRLEDNSTIDLKLTFSNAITNGHLYVQDSNEDIQLSADGVHITADGGVLDIMCQNETHPTAFLLQLEQLSSTTLSPSVLSTGHGDSHEKSLTGTANNNIPVIPLAAAIAGVVVVAIVVTATVVYRRRRRKSINEKEDQDDGIQYADIKITSLAPRDPKVVAKEEAEARAKLEASGTTAITYADVDFNGQHGVHNPSFYTEGMEYERVDAVKKQGRLNDNASDFSSYEIDDRSPASGDNGRGQPNLPIYAQVVKDVKKKKL